MQIFQKSHLNLEPFARPTCRDYAPFSFSRCDSGESDLDVNGDEDYSEDEVDSEEFYSEVDEDLDSEVDCIEDELDSEEVFSEEDEELDSEEDCSEDELDSEEVYSEDDDELDSEEDYIEKNYRVRYHSFRPQ
jgi:hypothetical protein